MTNDNRYEVLRPFGPSVARFTMPAELINTLNEYTDKIISDEKKSKDQDAGNKLAGQVTQEFDLDKKFIVSSGLLKFLGNSTTNWIKHSSSMEITKFNILASWVVRQFKNEYNPTHWHSGHISGVGYLKVPKTLGKTVQANKNTNLNGQLQLIHGSRQFLSQSTIDIVPKVGDFYFFPNYLMHNVFPFAETNDERRSISFNALIDENIYNVYGEK